MGNRAILKTRRGNRGVYLHCNGGRDSIEAFLKYCELKGFRNFEDDYGMARFCQVAGNFFGGTLCIGITDSIKSPGDNGVYIIKGWEIVGREDFKGSEQMEYDLKEMLLEIDKRQPESQQLGDFLTAEEVLTVEVKVGDMVYMQDLDGTYKKSEVVGIGEDRVVNGRNVKGIPFVNNYSSNGDYSTNPNNYIREETVRKSK